MIAGSDEDPALLARLVAIDPFGLGGIALRGSAGAARDRWIADLRSALGRDRAVRRVPSYVDESRLFGGLDLAATLAAGRPVTERGLLREADGGVLLLSMAERMPRLLAARLTAALDDGIDADGGRRPEIGLVALDEGDGPDERPPAALLERLAFWAELVPLRAPVAMTAPDSPVAEARRLYPDVTVAPDVFAVLVETAAVLGIASLRAPILAVRTARALAALEGRLAVEDSDVALAARLVLAPRATRLPVAEDAADEPSDDPQPERRDSAPPEPTTADDDRSDPGTDEPALGDLVLAATTAAIPPGLLLQLQTAASLPSRGQASGRSGAVQAATRRGRPAGVRRGRPGGGVRLSVIETLRAAAPWQRLRGAGPERDGTRTRLAIRRDDLRVVRLKQRSETTTLFVVDASGSLAANRLAEAKGAVELLLAECYVRRDQVALLAFRGKTAELLLPPTRSLARAKRSLAALPGGGPTPLAAAIEAAVAIADQVRRRGQTSVIVFLTDGRANVARDGTVGRAKAEADARDVARAAALCGARMLVIDAGARPQAPARALAETLGALYLPMPRAEAGALSRAVQTLAV